MKQQSAIGNDHTGRWRQHKRMGSQSRGREAVDSDSFRTQTGGTEVFGIRIMGLRLTRVKRKSGFAKIRGPHPRSRHTDLRTDTVATTKRQQIRPPKNPPLAESITRT